MNYTRINRAANARLKKQFEEMGITSCELNFKGCMGRFALSFCHRHKRNHYKRWGQTFDEAVEALSDISQVLMSCAFCHALGEGTMRDEMETRFLELRGDDSQAKFKF